MFPAGGARSLSGQAFRRFIESLLRVPYRKAPVSTTETSTGESAAEKHQGDETKQSNAEKSNHTQNAA